MAKVDSFEQFLKKQHDASLQKKVDWTKRKETWVQSVNIFYKGVKSWLAPFENKHLLTIQKKEVILNEDYIGDYKIDRLDIYLGNNLVSLIPRGTLIQGGVGIIDMRGPHAQVRLVQEDWNEWLFYIKTPFLETKEVNKSNFQEIIQNLVNA